MKKPNPQKKTMIMFSLIYLLFLSARAIFNPFVTVYLQEKGFAAGQIGLIAGANSLVIILAQPFWGIISDKMRSVKKTLITCMIFQAVFVLALVYCDGFLLIGAAFCMNGFFSSPEGPLLDTWSLKSLKEVDREKSVGQLKFFGCFGYAACSLLSGFFVNKYSTKAVIPVFAGILVIIALILTRVKTSAATEKAVPFKDLHLGRILKDKRLLIFLVFIFFMQLPHRASFTFYPLLITDLGGDKMTVGYVSAVMFISEGICLFFSRRLLSRFKPQQVIVLSAAFFIVWQLLYAVVTEPWQVAAIAVLDGPSFAMFTIGTLYYLDSVAPPNIRTTYQTLAYAVYFGLSGIAGNGLGGLVISSLGYRPLYLIGTGIIILSVVFFIISNKYLNKKGEEHESLGTL